MLKKLNVIHTKPKKYSLQPKYKSNMSKGQQQCKEVALIVGHHNKIFSEFRLSYF